MCAGMGGILQARRYERAPRKTDEWARRRIRAVYWKQWKKIKNEIPNAESTRFRGLESQGTSQ